MKTKPDLIITPFLHTTKQISLETKKLKIPVIYLFPDLFYIELNTKIIKFCFTLLSSILLRPIKKFKKNDFKKKKI